MVELNAVNPLAGTMVCAVGGLAGAVFALPFRGIKKWSYETYWFVYAIVGLFLFPAALAFATVPDLCSVITHAPGAVLARCFGFGALWGLGGLTWGLMIRYLGIGLGLAIGCGLCSATGTLIPPIVTGHAADLVKNASAVTVLCGVVGSLIGICFVGLAGKLKEGELTDEQKKKSVAEFNFKKGVAVALFSGVASAGMNFGLQGGAAIETAARSAGADARWQGLPVLVVVLLGGFIVNAGWCIWQHAKNKTGGDYVNRAAPLAGNIVLAASAGIIWSCQFACQKIGEPMMGEIKYISFAVVMGAAIFFSSFVGILMGEWKGVGRRTKACLTLGILILLVSFGVISYGNKLAPAGAPAEVSAAQ